MKPYQFYGVRSMPKLKQGDSITNDVQLTISGEDEDVRTRITLEKRKFDKSLSQLRISSEIKHRTTGYIRRVLGNERQKIDFAEYLEPVDFPAYLDHDRQLMVFNARKAVCRGVLAHLRKKICGIELVEMEVDFGKVMERSDEYLGAWFRGVSARVRAAGLSGTQIQDDRLFKDLKKVAVLSNVTLPWVYDGFEHPIMVTGSGGVVLVHTYAGNVALELRIVMDVHDQLLRHVWQEKRSKGGAWSQAPEGSHEEDD